MQIRKAERKKAKLRLGIAAPSGSGKTYGAILIAKGLGGKIGMIDTEHGSGDLYADLCDYDIVTISAPYTIEKYIQAIKLFEAYEYSSIIVDSLSHAWAGEGGLLDKQGKIADSGKGNGYTAWRTVTPEHNQLVDTILQSKCHIIATMRSKTEYVIEKNSNGKDVPRKIGMAPIQRDGMEYEFTVMLDIDMNHVASASKDRTRLFDGLFFKIDESTGEKLNNWLEQGEPEKQLDPLDIFALENEINEAQSKETLSSIWENIKIKCGERNDANTRKSLKLIVEARLAYLNEMESDKKVD